MNKVKVNNLPEYAIGKRFVVVRLAEDNAFWFYGAWDEMERASEVAKEIQGTFFSTEDIVSPF